MFINKNAAYNMEENLTVFPYVETKSTGSTMHITEILNTLTGLLKLGRRF